MADLDALVHLAGLFCLAGFLCRDQLLLRVLLFGGYAVYMTYYILVPGGPLWTLINWTLVFGAANIYGIVQLVLDRRHSAMSDDEQQLFSEFSSLSPGQFRRLMKAGKWMRLSDRAVLTREGEHADSLYYVLGGVIEIDKAGRIFHAAPPAFIGEIGWLLGTPATATVAVDHESRVVEWNATDLNAVLKRHPELRIRLEGLMNRDLAGKVAKS